MAKFLVIDFDSTFVRSEALEELAAVCLKSSTKREAILARIKQITKDGMEGKLGFKASLEQRLKLLAASRNDLPLVIARLKRKISPSILRNKSFFHDFKDQIYIVSGAFKEIVDPIVAQFGIDPSHVLANEFIYDSKGKITGFDHNNLLVQPEGKVKAILSLKLHGEIDVIGDGYTDLQVRELGAANRFIAFTENVKRQIVMDKADHIAPNFDEVLFLNNFPRAISFPKNRIQVVLLENIHPRAVAMFEQEGFKVEVHDKSLPDDKLTAVIAKAHVLGIRSRTQLTPELLKQGKHLLAVGAFCIGVEQIALDKAASQGVVVFNAPYSNTRSVVELALGEMIMLLRQITDKNAKLHQGIWDKQAVGSNEIRGKKLGIIGYGNIGTQLSVLAENLGMEVYYYDLVEKLSLGNAKRCRSMSELLKKADVVTVHVDGRKENKNLIGAREFGQMKDGVVFLNLSRGQIVDLGALTKAIQSGKVRGAGLDVFPTEPRGQDEPFLCTLQNLPNVILTPHIGGSTEEAQFNIGEFVATKLIDYINTGSSFMSVNFPNIQLPPIQKSHRLLHIHRNVPGMLAQINGIFAQHGINIEGQYLKTKENIGYCITDINRKYSPKLIDELKQIPDTISFRILY